VTVLLAVAPGALLPDPGTAHDWLQRELSRADYQESFAERFSRWFDHLLGTVSSSTSGGLGPVAGLVLLAVLAAGLAFALSRLRANPDSGAPPGAVFAEARLTSGEHRRRADAALAAERWGEAVVEAVRALAAGLVERGLMAEQSGVTVHEISQRACVLFPAFHERLEEMSLVFDSTRYGARPAGEEQARDVVDLERAVGAGRPTGDAARGPVSAVPR
jgi:hypothetical protein